MKHSYVERFENFLNANLPQASSFHPHYEKALQTMLNAGGKRFRPVLLLSVVDAYNPLLIPSSLHVAYAIELLHTYSLVHDDLPTMDNADLRRGHETLHKTYDDVTAVLVGDALNTYAFEVLSKAPLSDSVKIELIQELSSNGGHSGMVLGQAIDCHFENHNLELDQIKVLHTNKTAKLIAASLKMGAIIADKTDLADEIYDFGLDIGLLFQIQDDILDVTQSSEEAGKTTNIDGDKNSFVTLLGLEKAMNEANLLSEKLTLQLESFDENLCHKLSPILSSYLNRHKLK